MGPHAIPGCHPGCGDGVRRRRSRHPVQRWRPAPRRDRGAVRDLRRPELVVALASSRVGTDGPDQR